MLGRRTTESSGTPAPGAIAVAREAAEERQIAALRKEGARIAARLEPHINRGLSMIGRGGSRITLHERNRRGTREHVSTTPRGVAVATDQSYALEALRNTYTSAGYSLEDVPIPADTRLRQLLVVAREVKAREEGGRIAEALRPSIDRALEQFERGCRKALVHSVNDEGVREVVAVTEGGVVVLCGNFEAIDDLRIHYASAGYWVSDKPDPEHPDLHRLRVAPMHDCDPWSVSC